MTDDLPEDPIDFTPLDPASYPGAEERVVRAAMNRIRAGARPPLINRVGWEIERRAIPLLAAATVVFAVAALAAFSGALTSRESRPPTIAAALGVPRAVDRWMNGAPITAAAAWQLTEGRQ